MKTLPFVLFLALTSSALATEPRPPQKPPRLVYRTLDKMLKDFSHAAQAKVIAKR